MEQRQTSSRYAGRSDYIRTLYAVETPQQLAARKAAAEENEDNISLLPEEGKFLALIVRLAGVRKVVEIGTFYGYSALWIVKALPADGHLWTIEKDSARAARARHFLSDAGNVTLHEGDALPQLQSLAAQAPFDMVFIDADKIAYPAYLDWAEQNLRPGGLVVADNTLLFDAVWHDEPVDRVRPKTREALRQFNLRLADEARYDSVMLATEQGLTISRWRG